ncbi:unnamed protein product [Pleuronectes platessa]|uniref:Uncharacterized protein n=1 Tax=Pleuronectes platessa TaxID=8262 RepID=A0A9N7YPS2_PLEPL|nr:unnamed protein product [Pleuronectes platessa]
MCRTPASLFLSPLNHPVLQLPASNGFQIHLVLPPSLFPRRSVFLCSVSDERAKVEVEIRSASASVSQTARAAIRKKKKPQAGEQQQQQQQRQRGLMCHIPPQPLRHKELSETEAYQSSEVSAVRLRAEWDGRLSVVLLLCCCGR